MKPSKLDPAVLLGRHLALAALLLGLTATTAHAALITLDYHVSVTGLGPLAPVDPVTFTFHLTVDDTVTVTDQTDGLTVTDSNIALPSTPAFSYFAVGDGALRIFGLQGGFNLVSGTNDFAASFFFVSSTLLLNEFYYVQAETPRGFLFHTDGGVVTPVGGDSTGEVPEPLGLMAIGVALTGLRRAITWNRLKAG